MTQTCSVCLHADRDQIDEELAHALSYRTIVARHLGLSQRLLMRHAEHGGLPGPTAPEQASSVPASCPCMRVDWQALSDVAHQLSNVLQTMRDASMALYPLRAFAVLLAKMADSMQQP